MTVSDTHAIDLLTEAISYAPTPLRQQAADSLDPLVERSNSLKRIAHWPYDVMRSAEDELRAIKDFAVASLGDRA